MRVLITGASGLVGGRLLERLHARGDYQLRAASRLARQWPAGVEGVAIDYARAESIAAAVDGVDVVINLASMSERDAKADPQAALRANAGGTLSLASAAAAAKVQRFVQVSTFKVYGNAPSGRVTEESPTRPQSHYSLTHRAAEDYASLAHGDAVVLRLANGFGAPVGDVADCWSIIVNGMCRQAVVEERIGIMSSGRSWRNFVPMDDVTAAIEAGASTLARGTYQVASDRAMRIVEMAQVIARVCSQKLGFAPTITTGSGEGEVEETPLDYRHDRLVAAGVVPMAKHEGEIARTLLRARELFSGA